VLKKQLILRTENRMGFQVHKNILWLILAALLIAPSGSAQDYKYYKYQVKNGLPTDVVKDINQDDAGFVWIATDDGLAKFDGIRFTTYKSALKSQFTKRFLKSRDGSLYAIGDLDLIEIINDIDTVHFRSIRSGTRNPTDSTLWYPKSIYEDHQSTLWIGEPQSVVHISKNALKRFAFGVEDQSGKFTRSFSFFEDRVGNFYTVSYPGRVFRLNADKTDFDLISEFPSGVNDIKIFHDILWIAADDGLYRAECLPEGGFTPPKKISSITSASFIAKLNSGKLLITTFNNDQYTYEIATGKITLFPFDLKDVNTVFNIREDLFISTSDGLVLLQKNLFRPVPSPDFGNTFIESMTEDVMNDEIFFATLERLFKVSNKPGLRLQAQQIDFFPGEAFQVLLSQDNRLWVSSGQNILLYQDDKIIRRWSFADEGRFIYDLYLDNPGNLWISQDGNASVNYISPELEVFSVGIPLSPQFGLNAIRVGPGGTYALSGGISSYLFCKSESDSMFRNVSAPLTFPIQSDLSIVDMVDVDGVLWLASSEGLLKYNGNSLERADLGKKYTTQAVKTVKRFDDRELLFANSSGLFRFNIDNNEWWIYNEGNGLPSNTIHGRGVLVDHDKRVWVATSKGIAFSDRPIDLHRNTRSPWISQVLVNGKPSLFMNGLSVEYGSFIDIALASNSFPSGSVTLQYRSDIDTLWHPVNGNRIRIADMASGDHSVEIRAKNSGGYDWSAPRTFSVAVSKPYWQQYWFFATIGVVLFIVSLGSYSFARRIAAIRRAKLETLLEEITFKNRQLESQAAELNKAHGSLQLLYLEVDKQRETLQGQSAELMHANETLTKLSLDLKERHEEIQTQAEELMESNETIRQLNEGLEKKVLEKSKDLINTNEELSARNSDLLQFSYSISHNLRGPVARLLGLTSLLVSNSNGNEPDPMLGMIRTSALELDGVLHDLTDILELRKGLSNIRNKVIFADEWARSQAMLTDQHLEDFDIQTDFSACPYICSARGLIQSILYNLFSNAIKYRSPDRQLVIRTRTWKEGNMTFIEIRDNGLGMDLNDQNGKLFKLYKRFHSHVPGKGLGLYLVKTQAELLGGTIDVDSKLNGGTCFTITLPDPESIEHQVIFDNDTALLFYDANANCTVIQWKQQVTGDSYRKIFEVVLNTIKTYHSPGWIADLTDQGIVPKAEQQWFATTVLPEAVKHGLRRVASIGFGHEKRSGYFRRVDEKSRELGYQFKDFDNQQQALEWMKGGYLVSV
jgi:signal transduction histidine kinase/ligand-binding sensor domain-containing protein